MAGRTRSMRRRGRARRPPRESYLMNPKDSSVPAAPKHHGFRHKLHYRNEISASVGQQIFGSIMGASGALATLILGFKMKGALRVSVFEVVVASTIAAVGSFVGIYAVRSYH